MRQKLVNLESNERLDIPDAKAIVQSVAEHTRLVVKTLLAGSSKLVQEGFITTVFGNTFARITRGTGAFIGQDPLTVDDGQIASDGQTEFDIDFSSLAADTYTLWVKFNPQTGDQANRLFWNPLGDTEDPPKRIDTRVLPTWTAQAILKSAGNPGTEWVELAEVVWGGVSLAGSDITDTRTALFEGPLDEIQSTTGLPDYNRSTDRSSDHLKNLRELSEVALREIQDIKSNYWDHDASGTGHAWFTDLPAGLSIRSAQSATVTVGDGTASFGNFNADDPTFAGDAALAIQAAVDSMTDGGTVHIKPGVYTIKSTVTFPNSSKSYTVVGDGVKTTLLNWDSATLAAPFFKASPALGSPDIRLGGFRLAYQSFVTDQAMVELDLAAGSTGNIALSGIHFVSLGSAIGNHLGFQIINGLVSTREVPVLSIEDCDFEDLSRGGNIDFIGDRFSVQGCRFKNILNLFLNVLSVASGTISGCLFSGGNAAVNATLQTTASSSNVSILGCRVDDGRVDLFGDRIIMDSCVVEPHQSVSGPALTVSSNNTVISNCVFSQAAAQANVVATVQLARFNAVSNLTFCDCLIVTSAGQGVEATSPSDSSGVKIEGNILLENGFGSGAGVNDGIVVSRCNASSIQNNIVFRVGSIGIRILDCDALVCDGNLVVDDDLNGGRDVIDRIMSTGIESDALCTTLIISNNIVRGVRDRGLLIPADEALISDNLIDSVDGNTPENGIEATGIRASLRGNVVLDVDGVGYLVTGVDADVSGCSVLQCGGVGFNITGLGARVNGCWAISPGDNGFTMTGPGVRPQSLMNSVVRAAGGEGAALSGRVHMIGCRIVDPADNGIVVAASAIVEIIGCALVGITNAGSGFSAIIISAAEYLIDGCYIELDSSLPASNGIQISNSNGIVSACFLELEPSMTGSGIIVTSSGDEQNAISNCRLKNFNDFGIFADRRTVVSGCVLEATKTAVSSEMCVQLSNGAVMVGCILRLSSGYVGVQASGTGVSVISNCQFHGVASETMLDVAADGLSFIGNVAIVAGDGDLGGFNNLYITGNHGFTWVNATGTIRPASFATLFNF